jgi:hypothetical protein
MQVTEYTLFDCTTTALQAELAALSHGPRCGAPDARRLASLIQRELQERAHTGSLLSLLQLADVCPASSGPAAPGAAGSDDARPAAPQQQDTRRPDDVAALQQHTACQAPSPTPRPVSEASESAPPPSTAAAAASEGAAGPGPCGKAAVLEAARAAFLEEQLQIRKVGASRGHLPGLPPLVRCLRSAGKHSDLLLPHTPKALPRRLPCAGPGCTVPHPEAEQGAPLAHPAARPGSLTQQVSSGWPSAASSSSSAVAGPGARPHWRGGRRSCGGPGAAVAQPQAGSRAGAGQQTVGGGTPGTHR